jgi:hypothetical protein
VPSADACVNNAPALLLPSVRPRSLVSSTPLTIFLTPSSPLRWALAPTSAFALAFTQSSFSSFLHFCKTVIDFQHSVAIRSPCPTIRPSLPPALDLLPVPLVELTQLFTRLSSRASFAPTASITAATSTKPLRLTTASSRSTRQVMCLPSTRAFSHSRLLTTRVNLPMSSPRTTSLSSRASSSSPTCQMAPTRALTLSTSSSASSRR